MTGQNFASVDGKKIFFSREGQRAAQKDRNAICQVYARARAYSRGVESKRRTVETGGKQRVIEKRAPGMWVTFNLLQREKTRRRKNIDNWKVFSFAGRSEMRNDLGPVFDKVFFVLSPAFFFVPPSLRPYRRIFLLFFPRSLDHYIRVSEIKLIF